MIFEYYFDISNLSIRRALVLKGYKLVFKFTLEVFMIVIKEY